MTTSPVAYLFPGQGSYYAGALRTVAGRRPEVRAVLEQMDGPANELLGVRISTELLDAPPRPLDQWVTEAPDVLQLLLVAVGTATYRAVRAEGLPPGVLVGHSLGELAALASASILTPEQASEIVCQRALAIRQHASGGSMLALSAPVERVRTMLDLLGDDRTAIAVVNSDNQTVVAGPTTSLDVIARIAATIGIGAVPLKAPYAFHSPMLAAASAVLHERIRGIESGTATSQVFSPILGRYYRPGDNVPALVAKHLIRPVSFGASVRELHADGIERFVECGALDVLTRLVRRNLSQHADVVTLAPLSDHGDELAAWHAALASATASQPAPRRAGAEPVSQIAAAPAPPAQASSPVPTSISIRDRVVVLRGLVSMYAQALEYPEEVLAEDTDLEAELGVDSVKQTELLARVSAEYSLPAPGEDFRLSAYGNLGRIADLVLTGAPTGTPSTPHPAVAVIEPAPTTTALPRVPTTPDRVAVLRGLVSMYAQALEYPEEVFAEDTDLEAELGVDSVKQTELLARVSAEYSLPAPGEDFRLSAYGNLGRIADLVLTGAPTGTPSTPHPAVAVIEPAPTTTALPRVPTTPDRVAVLRGLVSMYAQALEYPEEVFAEDTDLEAELGVDSVKQTELLARVSAEYSLPAPGEDFRLSAYGNLGRIADLVLFQTVTPELLSA